MVSVGRIANPAYQKPDNLAVTENLGAGNIIEGESSNKNGLKGTFRLQRVFPEK